LEVLKNFTVPMVICVFLCIIGLRTYDCMDARGKLEHQLRRKNSVSSGALKASRIHWKRFV